MSVALRRSSFSCLATHKCRGQGTQCGVRPRCKQHLRKVAYCTLLPVLSGGGTTHFSLHIVASHVVFMSRGPRSGGYLGRVQVIKRYIMHSKKTAFIVEHDFIMAAYLADRVIVYEGIPSKEAVARCPQSLLTGAPCSDASSYSLPFLDVWIAQHLFEL